MRWSSLPFSQRQSPESPSTSKRRWEWTAGHAWLTTCARTREWLVSPLSQRGGSLDTETMFAGQFDEVLKETTGTQAVAVQAAQIARGSPPVGLSSFKIPKRPATQSKGQGPPKKKAKKGKSPSPQQQQQRDPQPPQQSSGPAREPTQRNFPPSSFSGSRGRGRGRGGSRPQWGGARSGRRKVARVRRSLGGVDLRQMGPPNHHIRLPNRVHWERALNQSSHVDSDSKEAFPASGSRRGPGKNASKEGDSPLKSFFPRTRALFLPFPSGETLRWMASHPKSAPIERSGQSVMNTLGGDIKLARDTFSAGVEASGPWAVSLDLQDAYFHVAINPRDTKFLRFAYDGEIFEFQVLPFGLSTAPRTFTRLVRAIGAYLKTFGINIFLYLDDWLVVGDTHQLALSYRDTVRMIT